MFRHPGIAEHSRRVAGDLIYALDHRDTAAETRDLGKVAMGVRSAGQQALSGAADDKKPRGD